LLLSVWFGGGFGKKGCEKGLGKKDQGVERKVVVGWCIVGMLVWCGVAIVPPGCFGFVCGVFWVGGGGCGPMGGGGFLGVGTKKKKGVSWVVSLELGVWLNSNGFFGCWWVCIGVVFWFVSLTLCSAVNTAPPVGGAVVFSSAPV